MKGTNQNLFRCYRQTNYDVNYLCVISGVLDKLIMTFHYDKGKLLMCNFSEANYDLQYDSGNNLTM